MRLSSTLLRLAPAQPHRNGFLPGCARPVSMYVASTSGRVRLDNSCCARSPNNNLPQRLRLENYEIYADQLAHAKCKPLLARLKKQYLPYYVRENGTLPVPEVCDSWAL